LRVGGVLWEGRCNDSRPEVADGRHGKAQGGGLCAVHLG